jgi:hypothetical protein
MASLSTQASGEGRRERAGGFSAITQRHQVGREIQHCGVRGPVSFADHRQRSAHPASRHAGVVVDRGQVVGDDLVVFVWPGLGPDEGQVLGGDRLGQHGALGDLAGQPQRPGAAHPGQNLRRLGRRVPEAHVAQPDVAAAEVHVLPGEQPPQHPEVLVQQGQRAGRPGAGLPQPVRHPVPDPDREPARVQPGQGRDLHGGKGHIAGRGRDDAEPHVQRGGGGQGRGRLAERAVQEAVLDQPHLVEAELLGPAHIGHEPGRRDVRGHGDTDSRPARSARIHHPAPYRTEWSGQLAL